MQEVNVRTFTHNFKKYMELVCKGETVVVTKYNKPIMDITPHNTATRKPNWKRKITPIEAKGINNDYITKIIRENRA